MANSDKNLTITPATHSNGLPSIEFTGGDNNPSIQLRVTDDGSLTFTGSAGQLFSVNNSFDGILFSANDVSGIPSIDVDSSGKVRLAPYHGYVILGAVNQDTTTPGASSTDILQVTGNAFVAGTITGSINLNATAPATDSTTGAVGEIRVDDQYIYVCTATDTWKRVELNVTSWS
jgi:hypothetical protein